MKMNTCSGCGGPVPARRKSATGDHWCKEPACQSKRQLAWRRRRAETSSDEAHLSVTEARLAYFRAAQDPERRRECHSCGLENAILGYAHPGKELYSICAALGNRGSRIGQNWLFVPFPSRDPSLVS